MPDPVGIANGEWCRANTYEFKDGAIVPASGAKIRIYDPWAASRERADAGGITIPIYQELIDVAGEVATANFRSLRPQDFDGILDWCSRYGLLGLLPHLVIRVRFHSTYEAL